MTTARDRSLRFGGRRVPVDLPSRRDPRLHTAAVIISIHVIGIIALRFSVSVPQILTAMVTAALIDVAVTLRRTGRLVWPASGLLTGSGVGLILRITGMSAGDYWSWDGWHWFALVAAFSVATKFAMQVEGRHVFNPSNVGLVLAFLVLGSDVVEPLDFWWAPLGAPMIVAYALIVAGGVVITRRLRLLEMALAFWVVLALGLAVLAATGHCMTASWSPTAVCDARFWTVLVTSPEVLIFVFFMITDPKTVPRRRFPRVVFAASLAVVATILMAPQSVEFGAKVGLLGSLVLWTPLRSLFDRLESDPAVRGVGSGIVVRLVGAVKSPGTVFRRGFAGGAALVLVVTGIIVAGIPAREPSAGAAEPTSTAELVSVDPTDLPPVEIDSSVRGLDLAMDESSASALAVMLAESLATEAEAIRTADGSLLGAADAGARLTEMQARLDEAIATGVRRAQVYRFESLVLRFQPTVGQSGAALALEGTGTVVDVTYDPGGTEVGRAEGPFESSFVLSQVAGERWLLVEVDPQR